MYKLNKQIFLLFNTININYSKNENQKTGIEQGKKLNLAEDLINEINNMEINNSNNNLNPEVEEENYSKIKTKSIIDLFIEDIDYIIEQDSKELSEEKIEELFP